MLQDQTTVVFETGSVFGNLNEEKNTQTSVCHLVLPTLRHISARKIASVPGKNFTFVSFHYHCDGHPSTLRLLWSFSQNTALRMRKSNSIQFTDTDYVAM